MKISITPKLRAALKKESKQIDAMMWIVGLVGPLATIPQIYAIFSTKSAEDISLLTWVLYLVTATIMLLYAVLHRIKPLIISQLLWVVVELILIGAVLYYS